MSYDFALEMKLIGESGDLHQRFADNVMCCQNMLQKYHAVFPNYTDHTALHSLEVIAFCNELVGESIDKLNTDEIFILLMAAYLHDAGMGISANDYEQLTKELPAVAEYRKNHPDDPTPEVIRRFHNEFSGAYIKKYSALFDFPSEEHLFAIIQTSRGHRKTDLFSEEEYPKALKLPNGNTVCLPYLAALIRLADELDIASDRNLQFVYDESLITNEISKMEFAKHKAIKHLTIKEDCFLLEVDASDRKIFDAVVELKGKLYETLNQCIEVVESRTDFKIRQKRIEIQKV